jgi:hypothetical protein
MAATFVKAKQGRSARACLSMSTAFSCFRHRDHREVPIL